MTMLFRAFIRPAIALAALLTLTPLASAALKVPAVFSDHAVLQQREPIQIWGWADPGTTVTVTLADNSATRNIGSDGKWSVILPARKAGGPYDLKIVSNKGEGLTIKDLLIGEVWVCSGQSNMEMGMTAIDKAQEEIAAANYPNIRLFLIPKKAAETPQTDVEASWKVCTPDAVKEGGWGGFSAAAYFFGRKLHKELNVPVGVIETAWGGTQAEPWTSPEGFKSEPRLAHILQEWESNVSRDEKMRLNPQRPSVLYNAMIAPITRLKVRGAIWYQGESNVPKAWEYRITFPNMIKSWREAFGEKNLPFYFVQIAPFEYSTAFNKAFGVDDTACAELWDSQFYTLKNVKHTGMVVISDVGDIKDIHPKNKQAVGDRLANWALAETYRVFGIQHSGPIYQNMKVKGGAIEVKFFEEGKGLTTRDGAAPTHFQIAGDDKQFHPATVTITDTDVVTVHSDEVKKPVAVRFAWHETAVPNLMNKEGLPASPFRTDDWKLNSQPKD